MKVNLMYNILIYKGKLMSDLEKEFLDNKNTKKDTRRLIKILSEFTNVYDKLRTLPPAISIFGSARINQDCPYYKAAYELSKTLSDEGYAIITGGGSGIMEAGNKGAKISVGLKIRLPKEQSLNSFVNIALNFKYFFIRKVSFIKYSIAFIVMPGGYGTLDELSEALCLIQTKRIGNFPIILFGKEFFEPLEDFFKIMLKNKYIKEEDMHLYFITDSIDEAVEYIRKFRFSQNNFENKE